MIVIEELTTIFELLFNLFRSFIAILYQIWTRILDNKGDFQNIVIMTWDRLFDMVNTILNYIFH